MAFSTDDVLLLEATERVDAFPFDRSPRSTRGWSPGSWRDIPLQCSATI